MRRELDTKVAFAIIGLLLVLVGAIYYFAFRTPSGELTPQEAGLGRPVRPGE